MWRNVKKKSTFIFGKFRSTLPCPWIYLIKNKKYSSAHRVHPLNTSGTRSDRFPLFFIIHNKLIETLKANNVIGKLMWLLFSLFVRLWLICKKRVQVTVLRLASRLCINASCLNSFLFSRYHSKKGRKPILLHSSMKVKII